MCFDIEIYYAIFVSLILFSSLYALKNNSLKIFFKTVWTYTSIILSDNYSIKLSKNFDRYMAGLWLISCTILLAAFSGQLWNRLMRAQTIDMIRSWNDLYFLPQWKHLKIQTFKDLDFYLFTEQIDSEMANNFAERLDNSTLVDPYDFLLGEKSYDSLDMEGVLKGTTVQCYEDVFLQIFKQNYIRKGFREDIDFHISEEGGGYSPYFVSYNSFVVNEFVKKTFRQSVCLSHFFKKNTSHLEN